jgi:S-layer protein
MALTPTAAQLAILRLNQTLFGTACGTTEMAAALPSFKGDIAVDGNNYAQSLIDNNNSLKILSPLQLFERVLNNISASNVTAADKTALANGLVPFVDAGLTVGATVNLLSAFLYQNAATLNNVWGDTAQKVVNQTAVASFYTLDQGNADASTAILAGVTEDIATVTTAENTVAGQAFMLTTGTDSGPAFTGTSGNDTFDAPVGLVLNSTTGLMVSTDTMQNVDVLKGGAGIDTLNFTTAGTVALPSLDSIEIINAQSLAALTIDTSAVAGVTNLNVIKAVGAVAATAAATTDVSVALEENGAGSVLGHTVNGGNNVTVTATKQGATASPDTITVGGVTAAAGDVVVNSTGAAYTAATGVNTLGAITVTGGKTISVTQKAAADTAAAAADTSSVTITQGAITANANADTTTVTIKQDAAVTAANAANTTGGVTETASAKFSALTAGQTISMGGLTFTAPNAMTAAEAAATFANLVNGAAYGALVPAGDTQGSGLATKGTYTGVFTGWTSAAASGDTVVFTSTTARTSVADLANTGTGTVTITTTEGKAHDATATGGKMGVVAGVVTVANGAALKTVTVDGYSAAGSAITGANTVMDTLNLSNGGAFTMSNSAATLALNLEKVNGLFTATAGAATLNVKSVGANTAGLAAANTTALNVSGTGLLNASTSSSLAAVKTLVVTETAGLNLGATTMTALESVNTTGTTGTVTVALSGAKAVYTGGAGVDNVTVTDAGTAVAKAIDLGAGDDKLTLNGTVLTPAVDLKGGDGTDTLSMTAASAAALGAAFAAKVSGFERLEVTGATGAQAIDTAALGNYNDIIVTAGAAAAATLTLNNLSSGATIRLNDAVGATNAGDAIVANIKDATTNLTDVLNVAITANVAADTTADDHGTITAAKVETINFSVTDGIIQTPTNIAPDAQTLTLTADEATLVNVKGDTALTLTLTGSNKVATIDASTASGALSVDLSAHNGVAMTIKGGSGNDVLAATVGTNAKADVLQGGAGNDTLVAGTNGATLTGGAGNDLFVLHAANATSGNKEANTYSTVTDFAAGDLLKLSFYDTVGSAEAVVKSFSKLGATLNAATAVFSDYVNAAMEQALATTTGTAGDAVWFSFGGNSYVVVDSGAETTGTFVNGQDLVIQLAGVDLANASYNATQGTIALV